MASYIENAKKVFQNNFDLKETESLLIVTDDELASIAEHFYNAGKALGNEVAWIQMPAIYTSGEEPPVSVAAAMKAADVALCITKASLTHTKARKEASAEDTRIGTMPGITLDMLEEGAITADPEEVEQLTARFAGLLETGGSVRIEKDDETVEFSIDGRKGIPSTGIFRNKGEAGNIPSGEAYTAPLEDSANGKFVVDGSIAQLGKVDEPVVLTIEQGRLVDASGEMSRKLLDLLGDGNGRIIAEFGIGTNTAARITGVVLEDEKVYGTVHIAFGSNKPFGGINEAGVHIDCVTTKPSVWIDDEKVM